MLLLLAIILITSTTIGGMQYPLTVAEAKATTNILTVKYIDVGQGDAILIKTPNNKAMMIDTGPSESEAELLKYLKTEKIKSVDVLMLSHPHEDHIGNASKIIKTIPVKSIYMTKFTTTTKVYKEMLQTIKDKKIKATLPVAGSSFNLDTGVKVTILGPNNTKYKDLNNSSIVCKISYGSTSFLFTGDAEDEAQKEILEKGYDLKSTVIKIPHHGGDNTTDNFIKVVNPKCAVICVGANNQYHHPLKSVLDSIKKYKATTYRTDLKGTITFTSNGKIAKGVSTK